MSHLLLKSSLVAATLIVVAGAASAQDYRRFDGASASHGVERGSSWGFGRWFGNQTPGIDRNQAAQRAEIERGYRNGSITEREYRQLTGEQARIADMERRAKADGIVTPGERHIIRDAQARAGQHIDEEKRDRETAGSRYNSGYGFGSGSWRRWW